MPGKGPERGRKGTGKAFLGRTAGWPRVTHFPALREFSSWLHIHDILDILHIPDILHIHDILDILHILGIIDVLRILRILDIPRILGIFYTSPFMGGPLNASYL